jgi:hypothetical protein
MDLPNTLWQPQAVHAGDPESILLPLGNRVARIGNAVHRTATRSRNCQMLDMDATITCLLYLSPEETTKIDFILRLNFQLIQQKYQLL